MIKLFSFVASCAGEKSKTAAFSDTLSEAFRKRAEEEGMEVRYERRERTSVLITAVPATAVFGQASVRWIQAMT